MKSQFIHACIAILSVGIFFSCEEERIEYHQYLEENYSDGFTYGYFTVHDNSIGYYNPDSGKVFPDIYGHQNGHIIGSGIHSFLPPYYGSKGLVTFERENRIEFIEGVNFLSKGSLSLDHPRNIHGLFGNVLISFGEKEASGISVINLFGQEKETTILTSIEPGKIFRDDLYFYVFSTGREIGDSVIVKLYTNNIDNPSDLHVTNEIVIGSRPVDYAEISLAEEYNHKGLAILCLGDGTEPASIVVFDLITQKIISRFSFMDRDFKPQNLFWTDSSNRTNRLLLSYANGKLYHLELTEPITANVFMEKNISDFYRLNDRIIAVSRDTVGSHSELYRIDPDSFEIMDSIEIEPRAKFVTGRNY